MNPITRSPLLLCLAASCTEALNVLGKQGRDGHVHGRGGLGWRAGPVSPTAPVRHAAVNRTADFESALQSIQAAQQRVANITRQLFEIVPIVSAAYSMLTDGNLSTGSSRPQGGAWARCFRLPGQTEVNLTVVTLLSGLSDGYMRGVKLNRMRFTRMHRYEYCEYSHDLRHPMDAAYSKVMTIRAIFDAGRPAVAWIDADALIMNFQKNFMSFVPDFYYNESLDVMLSDGYTASEPINTAIILTKNAPWSRTFWKSVWEDFTTAHPWDPNSILAYASAHPEDYDAHVRVLPHRTINAKFQPEEPDYRKGDFVMHVGGGPTGWVGCKEKWACIQATFMDGPGGTTCCTTVEEQ